MQDETPPSTAKHEVTGVRSTRLELNSVSLRLVSQLIEVHLKPFVWQRLPLDR
jgi:hypothetical protein